MLTEQRREEIKINLAYAERKMEVGEVSHYHVYKDYVTDVSELLQELDGATGRKELEERADEVQRTVEAAWQSEGEGSV